MANYNNDNKCSFLCHNRYKLKREKGSALIWALFAIVIVTSMVSILGYTLIETRQIDNYLTSYYDGLFYATDVMNILAAEDLIEWGDNDNIYTIANGISHHPIWGYNTSGGGYKDFLDYFPYPSNLKVRSRVPKGYVKVSVTGNDWNNLKMTVYFARVIDGNESKIYTNLKSGNYDAFTGNLVSIQQNFTVGLAYNISVMNYDTITWGKFVRIDGDLWDFGDGGYMSLLPIASVSSNMVRLFDGKGNKRISTYIFDSFVNGMYHTPNDKFYVYKTDSTSSSEKWVINSSTNINKKVKKGEPVAVVSYETEIVPNGLHDSKERQYKNMKIPFYDWCWSGNSDYDTCYLWEFRKIVPTMAPNIKNPKLGPDVLNIIFKKGYELNDDTLMNHLFSRSFNDIVQPIVDSAVRNNQYIEIKGSDTYVVTMITKNVNGKLHTILYYVPNAECDPTIGCYKTKDFSYEAPFMFGYIKQITVPIMDLPSSNDIHLIDLSDKGDGVLVKFTNNDGDLANIYVVSPCTQGVETTIDTTDYDLWGTYLYVKIIPSNFWKNEGLCHLVGNYDSEGNFWASYYKVDDSINPLARETVFNPNWKYEWTRYVFSSIYAFNQFKAHVNHHGVEPQPYHANWQNTVQYSTNITILANEAEINTYVIPAPKRGLLYEVDFKKQPQIGIDMPNAKIIPEGERLGFILYNNLIFRPFYFFDDNKLNNYEIDGEVYDPYYGSLDWHVVYEVPEKGKVSILYKNGKWQKTLGKDGKYASYGHRRYYGWKDNIELMNRFARYGLRFATDLLSYFPGNQANKSLTKYINHNVSTYSSYSYGWDSLFYASVYSYNGKFSYVTNEEYTLFSEVFKKLGHFIFRHAGGMLIEGESSCTGFCRERYYYYPRNEWNNPIKYWIIKPDINMSVVKSSNQIFNQP